VSDAGPVPETAAPENTARTPLFLDCDTGVDDALTLGYLAASPGVELVGVGSVSGNCSAEVGARNTLDLLALLGLPDVPVHVGAHDPLGGSFAGGAPHVHGADGVGGTSGRELPRSAGEPSGTSAAQALVDAARERPGRLVVLAVGPFTNLALALDIEPELPRLVRSLTVMGGAALAPGNITPVAEANVHNDPEAARRVVEAGFDLTVVGLDVTMRHLFEEEHRRALLDAGTPAGAALGAMLGHYFAFYTDVFGRPCCSLHDPLAAAVALGDVELASAPRVKLTVDDTDGPGRGQTIADLRALYRGLPDRSPADPRVVLEVAEEFAPVLLERLLAL